MYDNKMNSALTPENWLRLMSDEDRKKLGRHGMTLQEIMDKFVAKSEKELHQQIEGLLRLKGIQSFHSRTDKRTTRPVGEPDFLMAIKGQACAVEVKYGDGKLMEEQATILDRKNK